MVKVEANVASSDNFVLAPLIRVFPTLPACYGVACEAGPCTEAPTCDDGPACHIVSCGNPAHSNCVEETCAANSELHEVRCVLPLCLPSAPSFSHPVSVTDHAPLSHFPRTGTVLFGHRNDQF